MTRHQRAAIAAAEEWLARQPPTARTSAIASKIRNAVLWAAAQVGGFTGQRLVREGLKLTGVIAAAQTTRANMTTRRPKRRGKGPSRRNFGPVVRKTVRRSTKKRKTVKRKATIRKTIKRKKRKFVHKVDLKGTKRHFDDFGTVTRNHALYMGFESHGSKVRMWGVIAEAIAKELFAKMQCYPRSYDETFPNLTNYDTLLISFKRVTVPGGVDDVIDVSVSFNHQSTLETLAASLYTHIVYHADITNTTKSAMYMDKILIYNSANPDNNRITIKDIGESVLSFSASQLIKFQNLTPNNDGGTALDVTGVNPISGLKYEFKNHRAKLVSEIQALNTLYDKFQENTATGFLPGFALPAPDDRLGQPPPAREIFTNCAASSKISMAPGGFKVDRTTFKMKHKLSTFVERIYYSGYDKGNWGATNWYGFERSIRQVPDSTHTKEDSISLSWNRELHMAASIKFKVKKSMLKHYERPAGIVTG